MERLIGIGDIHGAYDQLVLLMEKLNEKYSIFDSKNKVKEEILIEFNGDFIDRGLHSCQVLEYVMKICKENKQVQAKMGNHELLALEGLDSAKKIVKQIEKNEITIDEAYELYANLTHHGYNGGIECILSFAEDPKEAIITYIKRMSRDGDIGVWLRSLPAYSVREINNKKVLFSHADIDKENSSKEKIEAHHNTFKKHMGLGTEIHGGSEKKYDPRSIVMQGFFWKRVFSKFSDKEAIELVNKLDVDYVVVGHTVRNGIWCFGGVLFSIDVGMVSGREAAAIVFDPEPKAFYVKQGEKKIEWTCRDSNPGESTASRP